MRRLHRMYIDYPTEVFAQALRHVENYGRIDLFRIEKAALKTAGGDPQTSIESLVRALAALGGKPRLKVA